MSASIERHCLVSPFDLSEHIDRLIPNFPSHVTKATIEIDWSSCVPVKITIVRCLDMNDLNPLKMITEQFNLSPVLPPDTNWPISPPDPLEPDNVDNIPSL